MLKKLFNIIGPISLVLLGAYIFYKVLSPAPGITNKQIVEEVKYCHENILIPRLLKNEFGEVTKVICDVYSEWEEQRKGKKK